METLAPSPPSRCQTPAIEAKKHSDIGIKLPCPCPTPHISLRPHETHNTPQSHAPPASRTWDPGTANRIGIPDPKNPPAWRIEAASPDPLQSCLKYMRPRPPENYPLSHLQSMNEDKRMAAPQHSKKCEVAQHCSWVKSKMLRVSVKAWSLLVNQEQFETAQH